VHHFIDASVAATIISTLFNLLFCSYTDYKQDDKFVMAWAKC